MRNLSRPIYALIILIFLSQFYINSIYADEYSKGTFAYKADVGKNEKIELIKIHINDAFKCANQDLVTVDRIWQASEREPFPIIYESSKGTIITSSKPLELEEGYVLSIVGIDENGNSVILELTKDGKMLDNKIVIPPKNAKYADTYDYDVGNDKLIKVHFKNNFWGADQKMATVDRIWQASESEPSSIIYESTKETIITSSEPLELEEGYVLSIMGFDMDGNRVILELIKDGEVLDSKIVIPLDTAVNADTYDYYVGNDAIIKVHLKNAFRGADQNLATVDSIWQASENDLHSIIYDSHEEKFFSSGTPIELEEGYSLSLESIDIDGNKALLELTKDGEVLDSKIVIPPKNAKDADTYDYDVGNNSIIKVHFKNTFRGCDANLATVDRTRQTSENDPHSIIYDSYEEKIITHGTPLELKEGHLLSIKSIDIDGNKALLELTKDGEVLDSKIVIPPNNAKDADTYDYDVGNNTIIKVHFKNAFRGADQNLATVDSIWQASENDPHYIIYDSYEEKIFTSGTPLKLGEGYLLSIKSIDIDGNKAFFELTKEGDTVDNKIMMVQSKMILPINKSKWNDTYTYHPGKNVVIKVHFKNAFNGGYDQDQATLDRIWQVSETEPYPIIYDSSNEITITDDMPLVLKEGYLLLLNRIDEDGVHLYLKRNWEIVDNTVVIPSDESWEETYVNYIKKSGLGWIEIIKVHFKNASSRADQDLAAIDRITQISDVEPYNEIYNSSNESIYNYTFPLKLKEGYVLALRAIDVYESKIYISLYKNGIPIDSSIIRPNDIDFQYICAKRNIPAKEIMHKIERGEMVKYDRITVDGDLNFADLNLSMDHSEMSGKSQDAKYVNSPIIITNSEINGNLNFNNIILNDVVDFRGTNFMGQYTNSSETIFFSEVSFVGTNFAENTQFAESRFKGNANFKGANFKGNANFAGTRFEQVSTFESSYFVGKTFFVSSRFNGGANFAGIKFRSDSDFRYSQFSKIANFSRSQFEGNAYFWNARFYGNAYFNDVVFDGSSEFLGSKFDSKAYFEKTQFIGNADFSRSRCTNQTSFHETQFKEYAYFEKCNFSGNSLFTLSEFNKMALFTGTVFENASFMDAHFGSNAYFEKATFVNLNLTRTGYNRLFLPWKSIEKFQMFSSDEDAYQSLIRNYMTLGWFKESNSCYYEYRNKCRKNEPMGIQKITDSLEWLVYGYGVKPVYSGLWIAFFVFFFGIILKDSFCKYKREEIAEILEEKSTESSNVIETRIILKEEQSDPIDAILFSLATFTSGLTSFLYPNIEYKAKRNERLIIVERLIGSLFIAIFITAISKTYLIR
jgi:uncharacterized protein YjbI with pentapeptide repeats